MYFLYLVTNKGLQSGPALFMTIFGSIVSILYSLSFFQRSPKTRDTFRALLCTHAPSLQGYL